MYCAVSKDTLNSFGTRVWMEYTRQKNRGPFHSWIQLRVLDRNACYTIMRVRRAKKNQC